MKFNPPKHIAVIMDGNGRWATARLLARKMGHREGVKTLHKIVRHAFSKGVKYFTVYAFSTENRNRPSDEVEGLIDLIRTNFRDAFSSFIKDGIRICVLGDRFFFPSDVVEIINKVEKDSENGENGVFNIALNYGGRAEIIRAVNQIIKKGNPINEEEFKEYLYTALSPDPDIILRTGGEKRLSNFLLYQSAYAELFFTDTLWPDYTEKEFDEMLESFSKRNRRYGKVE